MMAPVRSSVPHISVVVKNLAITQGTLGNSSCPTLLALEALSSSEDEVQWAARALST